MSTRGMEGIVAAMRDDERERMLEPLLEAMAGEMAGGDVPAHLAPEGGGALSLPPGARRAKGGLT